jgi:hypothetical protein
MALPTWCGPWPSAGDARADPVTIEHTLELREGRNEMHEVPARGCGEVDVSRRLMTR